MTLRRMLLVSIVAISMAWPATLTAQEPLPFDGPAAERIEQYKKLRMMDFLKLDEETSVRFFSRYNRFVEELRALNERRNATIDDLQALVRRDATDQQYRKVFEKLNALSGEQVALRDEYMDDLRELLPPKKVASYIVFERNFYRNLRELLRQAQQERSRRNPR